MFQVCFPAYQKEENPMKQMFRFLQRPLESRAIAGSEPSSSWSMAPGRALDHGRASGGEFRPRRRSWRLNHSLAPGRRFTIRRRASVLLLALLALPAMAAADVVTDWNLIAGIVAPRFGAPQQQ